MCENNKNKTQFFLETCQIVMTWAGQIPKLVSKICVFAETGLGVEEQTFLDSYFQYSKTSL
jgi:hypothetical protein